jgi:hypothetical protein
MFHNYTSFLVFSASLPSQHFNTICSIRIIQNRESYGDRVDTYFPTKASYRALHSASISVRNPDLPTLQLPLINAWQHTCTIIAKMQGLKRFTLDAHSDAASLSCYLGGSEGLWEELDMLREQRNWEEFEIKTGTDRVLVVSVGNSETMYTERKGRVRPWARPDVWQGGMEHESGGGCECWMCQETR